MFKLNKIKGIRQTFKLNKIKENKYKFKRYTRRLTLRLTLTAVFESDGTDWDHFFCVLSSSFGYAYLLLGLKLLT